MYGYPEIVLKKGKDIPLQRFHPWIYSGAICRKPARLMEGDIVEVLSSSGKYLATGHYQEGSIAVKVFSFERRPADTDFWLAKLRKACILRDHAGLIRGPLTNACRLVYSEGDGLPGLIIDWYNGVAVIQAQAEGMKKASPQLVEALRSIFGEKLKAVYLKNLHPRSGPAASGSPLMPDGSLPGDQFLFGNIPDIEILETGHRFRVDVVRGQKTGFFTDQRSNRMFAQFYARGRRVLNAFCYSGAFSVYAAKGGAARIDSVDSSAQAIEWCRENINLNAIPEGLHREFVADMKDFLPDARERYDLIILDPPAFAKTHRVTHNALQAYIFLNASAIRKIDPGGIICTFSCSQAITREMFRSAIQAAAIECRRPVKVLHQLSQGPDHPVSVFHPEGEYLKGLILEVD